MIADTKDGYDFIAKSISGKLKNTKPRQYTLDLINGSDSVDASEFDVVMGFSYDMLQRMPPRKS